MGKGLGLGFGLACSLSDRLRAARGCVLTRFFGWTGYGGRSIFLVGRARVLVLVCGCRRGSGGQPKMEILDFGTCRLVLGLWRGTGFWLGAM